MRNNEAFEFRIIKPDTENPIFQDVVELLCSYDLTLDENIECFVVMLKGKKVVACAGIDHNVIKCVAIDSNSRQESLSLQLMGEVTKVAAEQGHFHLFLYTKPENVDFFKGCGFYPLVTVPGSATLMENTPVGISRYCKTLSQLRQPGERIGAIVINANPFTLGHRYLVEQAAAASDWLHLFIVQEDLSMFAYSDRIQLVRAGVADIPHLTVHEGSSYMVSKATFPTYFIKEKSEVGKVSTAMDLLMFRNYIAPALGITHRFAGTEPICGVTKQYNEDMLYWLQNAPNDNPPITFIELERTTNPDGLVISASAVREALRNNDFERIATMVPETTLRFLEEKYKPATRG